MDSSEQLVNLIRDMIKEEISKKDSSVICKIESVNLNGTVNISLLSDPTTIIPNVKNTSQYEFAAGDYGVLYKIENKLSNSFIFSKIITTPPVIKPKKQLGLSEDFGFTVENVDGADNYGFKQETSGDYAGYYKSQNSEVNNSYSLCKVIFRGNGRAIFYCINSSETGYDFGLIGNVNQILSASSATDANVKKSFINESTESAVEVVFDNIKNGDFIMCKYKKDNTGVAGMDAFLFKISPFFLVQDLEIKQASFFETSDSKTLLSKTETP